MPTILDRLLGREPAQKAVVTGTGGTGPGVIAWHNGSSITSTSRNPRRLMKQAQELYHRDLIIRAAEHRVSAAAAGLPWHLEDENEDEVTDESPPELLEIRDWLDKPQGALTERRQMTRRALWQITSRHSGLCGTAFWYQDQRTLGTGQPLVSLYVNPARMYPVQNTQGILLGWKLDADEEGNGGVPLELDEVLQFDFEPPDWGHYGIGLVESAWSTHAVSSSIERHEAGLFSAGARLAGLISPKTASEAPTPEQWEQTVRDWRNITSDPESAKRLHILRGPVDFVRTGATMQELAVDNIAKMAREDKLALWGVPLSQLPLPVAAGMNSGETKAFDEAVFFQGAVHDRVLILSEVIQTQVLDRIAGNGGPNLRLVIEEPEFDDTTPLFERAVKALDQPLMVNERRGILNMDPLPDYSPDGKPLGTAIYISSKLTLVGSGPDEAGNLIALPEPPPVLQLLPGPEEEEPDEVVPAKAQLRPIAKLREEVERKLGTTQAAILKALRAQGRDIAAKVREKGSHLAKRPTDTSVWWNPKAEEKRLRLAIEPHSLAIAQSVTSEVARALRPGKAEPFTDTVEAYVRERTGLRIVGINETTRDAISDLIAEGFKQGLGPNEVADSIEAATQFDEARAETIARTESAYALNEAQVSSYREFGIGSVEVIDGDMDTPCSDANGATWTLDQAQADPLAHPQCRRDFIPLLG